MGYKIKLYDIDDYCIGSGELTLMYLNYQLEAAQGVDVDIHISSAGGSAFEALGMYDALKKYAGKVTVYIDALAASAASVIAMAGNEVVMSKYALLMIHKPMTGTGGNADEIMRDVAMLEVVQSRIAEIYMDRTGLDLDTINSLINAVTWMTADQALSLNFIDRIDEYAPADVTNAIKMQVYAKCAPAIYQRVINKLPINKQSEMAVENKELLEKSQNVLTKVMNFFKSVVAIKTVTNKGTLTSYQPLAKGVKVFNEADDEPAEDTDELEITNAEGKKVKASIKDGVINEMEEDKPAEAENKADEKEAAVMNSHGIKVTNKAEIPAVLNLIKKVDEQNELLAEAKNVINGLTAENKKTEEEIRAKIKSEFTPEGSKRSDKLEVKNKATFTPTSEGAKNAAAFAVARKEGKI